MSVISFEMYERVHVSDLAYGQDYQWCWVVENSETICVVILFRGLVGGGIGLGLARWGCLTADRNLLRERCQMGMKLLGLNPRYTARVAGASILSDILNSESTGSTPPLSVLPPWRFSVW